MKKAIFILIAVITGSLAISQEIYPEGCYMSFEEIRTKSPSKQSALTIKERTDSDIKMNGGNDYKLISLNKSLKRKFLKKEIFAYSNGDDLFINCLPYKLQTWYSKILSKGQYLVFVAGIPMDMAMQSKEMQAGMAFGGIGGAFAGASLAMKRYLYILEIETNQVTMIDFEEIKDILNDYPELYEKFMNETRNTEILTQVEYLKKVNEENNKKTGANNIYKK